MSFIDKRIISREEFITFRDQLIREKNVSIKHFLKEDIGIFLKIESLKYRLDIKRVLERSELSSKERKIYERGNVGIISWKSDEFQYRYSHSAIDNREDDYPLNGILQNSPFASNHVFLRKSREFKTIEVPIRGTETFLERYIDTEAKLLEYFFEENRYNNCLNREIYLYTDRYPCPSCLLVVAQFMERFSSIQLKIFHDDKKMEGAVL